MLQKPVLIYLLTNLVKAAKNEIQNSQFARNIVSLEVLGICFPLSPSVFNLSRNTYSCCGLKKARLLREAERGSTLSNKFWLCCSFFIKHATCLGSTPNKSTNQRAAFLQHATNVFAARQVDHARWKTGNIDPTLASKQCCATRWGFLYLVFRRL